MLVAECVDEKLQEETVGDEIYPLILRLRGDVAEAARTMGRDEARYLVDTYYQVQHLRVAAAAQIRSLGNGEPHATLAFIFEQCRTLERQCRRALDLWSNQFVECQWARSVCGVGPVIAAGLRAHIDIEKAPTVGHIWRFAGLDPTTTWERKHKRPWNAFLKTLVAFKLGESFVKVKSRDADFYGKLYEHRKAYERERNERGEYKEQAAAGAERVGKKTEAHKWYAQGKLPPGHLHARARRWTAKLFLAHYHHVAYMVRYGTPPPKPYVLTHCPGHEHIIEPPNMEILTKTSEITKGQEQLKLAQPRASRKPRAHQHQGASQSP